MSRQTYLNPKVIQLDNLAFVKMDIVPGSAQFVQADFAVHCAGSINELSIIVDRINNEVIKSTSGPTDALVMYTDNANTKFFVSDTDNNDATLSSGISLNTNIAEADFHNNIKLGVNAKDLIHGAIFTLIVKAIFPQADTGNLDLYDSTVRSNKIFFKTDATEGDASAVPVVNSVIQDINIKTLSIFNETLGGISDEYNYWNVRTSSAEDDDDIPPDYLETDEVKFQNGDKIYCYYQINTSFTAGTTTDLEYNDFAELNALSNTGTPETPFNSVQLTTTFVLGYDILKAGAVFVYTFTSYSELQTAVTSWCDADVGPHYDTSGVEATYGHISNWDVSNITDMQNLFPGNSEFNQPLNNWDVSKVTNMTSMFYKSKHFNQNIGAWDVSKVTDMYQMFCEAEDFDNGSVNDLSSWNVSKVKNISRMFRRAYEFNRDISSWDISSVTDFWNYGQSTTNHHDSDFTASDIAYFTGPI